MGGEEEGGEKGVREKGSEGEEGERRGKRKLRGGEGKE